LSGILDKSSKLNDGIEETGRGEVAA